MILQRLRAETARNHSAIESQMPVLDPRMALDTYRQLLTRFWGYYAPLEKLLRAEIEIYWPDREYLCSERAKVPNLERDLKALGESCKALECCTNLPLLKSPAQVLGCLYVIEGATLGGQIISKHLLANLGLGSDSGAAFFNGYGADSGQQWQSFRLFITSKAEPMQQDDEIIASANNTFKTLGEWLFPSAKSKPPANSIEPEALAENTLAEQRELPGVDLLSLGATNSNGISDATPYGLRRYANSVKGYSVRGLSEPHKSASVSGSTNESRTIE